MLKKAVYESLSPVWKDVDDKHTNDLELLEDWANHYSRVVELYQYDMEANTFVVIRQCGVSTDVQPLRLWITDDQYYHTIVNKEKLIDCFIKANLLVSTKHYELLLSKLKTSRPNSSVKQKLSSCHSNSKLMRMRCTIP